MIVSWRRRHKISLTNLWLMGYIFEYSNKGDDKEEYPLALKRESGCRECKMYPALGGCLKEGVGKVAFEPEEPKPVLCREA